MSTTKLAIDGGEPVRAKFLPFGVPSIGEEEINEVVDTLRSGWIGTGPKTMRFEQEFAEYVGSKYAVSVNSCTAGLHLSLLVSGVGSDDEVITTALTFAATANVIEHCRAKPVFVDIDPLTLNIDPAQVEQAITSRTKVILPVHFGGLPCEMNELLVIARRHNLTVVEDAAHAVGSRYRGKMIGHLGNLTNFSFYPNKNMTTIEGGMVTTDDADAVERLKVLRLHGLSADAWKRFASHHLMLSQSVVPGFKYNMTDVQASLGLHQLRKVESWLNLREEYARRYDGAFSKIDGVRFQAKTTDEGSRNGLHLYVLLIDREKFSVERNDIINAILAENVGAALHYRALHTHPFYRDTYGYRPEDFPEAYKAGEEIFSLPISPLMNEEDVMDVIAAVRKVLTHYHV